MSGETSLPGRLARRLRWLLVVPLLVVALYLVVINLLLNLPWTQAWLNERGNVSVHWDSGWSLLPGQFNLRELRLSGVGQGASMAIDVAGAELGVSLDALLSGHVELERGAAKGLRTARLGRYRLEGAGNVSVSGLRLTDGRLVADQLMLALGESRVWRDETLLANDITLDAGLSLAPIDLAEPFDLAATRHLSGELSLAATADAWDVFAPYLRDLDWLGLAGHGELRGELRLEDGVLTPGSELILDSPSLVVEIDESLLLASGEEDTAQDQAERRWIVAGEAPEQHRLSGGGRITSTVTADGDGRRAELEIELNDMVMQRAGLAEPFMTSQRFLLAASLPGADLADAPRRLSQASLEWRDARLPNVGALAVYLPEGGPLTLESGSAGLDGRLDYADGILEGGFHLAGSDIALTLLGQTLGGELALDLMLELDPTERRLDLSGSHLAVTAQGERDAAPLTTTLSLDAASLQSSQPVASMLDGDGPLPLNGRIAMRGQVGQLSVLDTFLDAISTGNEILLDGDGELAASLRLEEGRVASGSQLAVTTESLGVNVLDLNARGRGSVVVTWLPALGVPRGRLEAQVEQAQVVRLSDARRLMQDGTFELVAESDLIAQRVLDDLDGVLTLPRLTLSWRGAEMPDVDVLQVYLPETLPFRLSDGRAVTNGQLEVEEGLARGRIDITGQRISGRLFDEPIDGELALDLRVSEARLDGSRLDLSGSQLEIQAATAEVPTSERLRSRLIARRAVFGPLPVPGGGARAPMSGELALNGLITNLGMLEAFLPAAQGLTLTGSGRFTADLSMGDDRLLPGSLLRVSADELAVGFLDYQASGRGTLDAMVEGSREAPGVRLELGIPQFDLVQRGDERPHVSGRHFTLETLIPDMQRARDSDHLDDITTRIRLPIANLDDLSRYNAYLPSDAGLELLSGQAGIEADLTFEGLTLQGDLVLQAFDAGLRLADQQLNGDLRLDAQLRDGDINGQRFDATGTRLRLDNISRQDASGQRDAGWWARLELVSGQLTWAQPLVIDAKVALAMRDSGLLARLFLDSARENAWLGRWLTVRNLEGTAGLHVRERELELSDARLEGHDFTLLASLLMRDESLSGDLYARLGALGVGIALVNGETRLRLLQPRRWFEQRAGQRQNERSQNERSQNEQGQADQQAPDEPMIEVTEETWQQAVEKAYPSVP
ncbi:hypothetical protein [Halomonas urumqiensis]|uniref:Uncharacterized protein n=1 Tax=Halomonas urumqiensis TaxID=1684789 RepID=A0A2N7UMQ8_9GAMM|nr:hypothetical protein [Halomonas urumqiensis]PMR81711.1 hypothetical protein C1H70_04785 [Halomonas urumqiensis]PTB02348.1 hypothetical protein C6V82_11765 [Halomonas urumqiensis]GHE21825.1 hypothetical protein GCM10017767_23460 [Halomonas urumqiensis]